ncbi:MULTISPECIES: EAL domain-containing protein [unclassified Enterobacter]|uniref:EAL domain-containing protein n=1 Tax=unclassified Enterobacter TaxID=2608935 RepID=UPI00236596D7|nr:MULTISPECIES: EAL domain-containing protein [unclassified Enterobacter]
MHKITHKVWGGLNKLTANISLKIKSDTLRSFLEGSEVIPHIQPIFSNDGDTVIGCEVLLRIRSKGEFLTPSSFIYDLEIHNMYDDVVCQLIKRTWLFFTSYKSLLPKGFYFSFNLYASQLKSSPVIDEISFFKDTFKDHAVLVIEIIDRDVDTLDDDAITVIDSLMSCGIQFAIDNFGIGAAQLKIIEHIGFSQVKIARELTINSCGELVYKNVIAAIVMLSHKLGIKVIADGVESSEQITLLEKAGVDGMQGYFLAKPMPMDMFIFSFITR